MTTIKPHILRIALAIACVFVICVVYFTVYRRLLDSSRFYQTVGAFKSLRSRLDESIAPHVSERLPVSGPTNLTTNLLNGLVDTRAIDARIRDDGTFLDGWSEPMAIERCSSPVGFTLRSAGPDRRLGTADDIVACFPDEVAGTRTRDKSNGASEQ